MEANRSTLGYKSTLMANKYDKLFMKIAGDLAEMSHCCRVQVGAVIVREGRIISTGWNGTPPGHQNCDDYFAAKHGVPPHAVDSELHSEFTEYEVHAETNALLFAARHGMKVDGATIYTTTSPCLDCGKAIITAGIKRVVFKELYDRDQRSLAFMEENGVEVVQLA